ncbi:MULTISPECIES: anhydro-N-acetylmuramic acid kinase [Bizionia]|uniref:Anhydro-N-acetylmuramic acid kinase n=1 Tax=Bizionia algoritergicola TaxID=291187 RepID=A0A5D0QRV7_9FLAO|nr:MULTISPECIES: anhydro-N-acetylmuramic acid kinase [Bizionia]OBX21937.1 anhydro-N-acetylmuramic acid kinase [Bizionia sp. APA-3]TYB71892.1 anhydro-N-acetylmuramic acid kinase [Bizionia algoritergicola]
MIKSSYNVLGIMSGTSLDGVDIAHISFTFNKKWQYTFLECDTIPYPNSWFLKLKNLVGLSNDNLEKIDQDYTEYLASVINAFIQKHQITDLDFISSHGHTALHEPEKGVTLQIGNRKILAYLTQQTVVCDFRVQDVQLGGQGAPLVPIGDKLLFSDFDYCLNLGGFANISTEDNGQRIAFDICPANIVLNHYVASLGLEYDDSGNIAAKGKVNVALLNELNSLEFYKKTYPKSLGLEWVDKFIFPCIDAFEIQIKDILRTFVVHIAIQIGHQIKNGRTLITGGGAYNSFLIEEIKAHTNTEIVIPNAKLINFKEALIFSLLGVLKQRNEVNCLASVTGAKMDHSSGKTFQP